jgi:hypothetical protein
MPRRPWTEDEVKRARDMRTAGYPYNKIDKALGRRAEAKAQADAISDSALKAESVMSLAIFDAPMILLEHF